MNNKPITFSLMLFFCLTAMLFMGCKTVEGKVSLKGNEPLTYVVITTDNGDYKLVGELADEIAQKYQQQVVKVKGKVVKESEGPLQPAELEVTQIIDVVE